MIPPQLKHLKFCRIKKGTKKPFEKDWVNKPHTFEEMSIIQDENYGVLCGYEGIVVIDCDTQELKDSISKSLPETFTVKTGGGGTHFYYICKEIKKKIVLQIDDKHFGEVQSHGTQVVGANSLHPNGNYYSILNDKGIAEIKSEQLTLAIKPFMKEIKTEEIRTINELKNYGKNDINSISITSVINTSGFKKALNGEYYGSNPWHGSETKMNFWINPYKNVAHCFRHDCGINIAQAIALNEGIIKNCKEKVNKEDFFKVLEIAREKYGLQRSEIKEKPMKVFTDKKYQTEEFGKIQPIFYDKSGSWWLWNNSNYCWEIVDDIDILNMIEESSPEADIINSKSRGEILNALKQYGRKKIPKEIKPTWIQFKGKIIDFKTGEKFIASPEYFVTNPIPWELNKDKFEETPIMDKIFTEWVGEKFVKILYEIIAYCLISDYPIHRLFCLIGAGSNGKGCFLRLIENFIGKRNVTASELDTLLTSRFEITRIYKKLVCIMGETNFAEISKTSIIKKLTGQDIIGFEYKNKTPFEGNNYAKIIIATNNLPTTTDKSIGFYRRWCIIDFPNRFSEKKDILKDIPNEEYESLALKSLSILKDLLERKEFTNEGTIEERAKKYEDKSDFLEKFIKEFTEESLDSHIWKNEFEKKFNEWCRSNRYREMSSVVLGRAMKERGMEQRLLFADWMNDGKGGSARAWISLKWKYQDKQD